MIASGLPPAHQHVIRTHGSDSLLQTVERYSEWSGVLSVVWLRRQWSRWGTTDREEDTDDCSPSDGMPLTLMMMMMMMMM